ncbi:GGDEF domain-containing protein [Bordetella sp. FB-8]|uniref:GGDEF domain-containing protein n=1 Tax=Bordetella sp. FB-8 TaxID=1159870 RepID=UPI00047669F8|nr:GGDEF domain-containing protein [Bordetella sp. FB-8]
MTSSASSNLSAGNPPDLFESEMQVLRKAREIHDASDAGEQIYRQALGELIGHFERMMRQTRRMIGHSDRAEREMHELNIQLQTLTQKLEYHASHDALTGIFNRRAVIEQTNKVFSLESAVMIVLDIDHFKRINDEFGHPVGDRVILGVTECLRGTIGETGIVGRVGGEEFTVLLPRVPAEDALGIAQTLRTAITGHAFGAPVERPVTASFGLSANPRGTDFDTAYNQADAALYAAKRAGRNRVEIFDPRLQTLA